MLTVIPVPVYHIQKMWPCPSTLTKTKNSCLSQYNTEVCLFFQNSSIMDFIPTDWMLWGLIQDVKWYNLTIKLGIWQASKQSSASFKTPYCTGSTTPMFSHVNSHVSQLQPVGGSCDVVVLVRSINPSIRSCRMGLSSLEEISGAINRTCFSETLHHQRSPWPRGQQCLGKHGQGHLSRNVVQDVGINVKF